MGLDGALRAKGDRFIGILNGLDTDGLGPGRPTRTSPRRTRGRTATGKAACRADLLDAPRVRSRPTTGAVLGMIGRLDPQKGFDLLADARAGACSRRARGSSSRGAATRRSPTRSGRCGREPPRQVALIERFDRTMARRIYAGADFFLMPSRFEPCGQGQMIALRYGTPPIVRRTGGLADTVIDETTHPGDGDRLRLRRRDAGGARRGVRGRAAARVGRRPARGRRCSIAGWPSTSTGSRARRPRYVEAYRRAIAIRRRRLSPDRPSHARITPTHPDPPRGPAARRPRWPGSSSSRSPTSPARWPTSPSSWLRAGVDLRAIGGGGHRRRRATSS